MDVYEECESRLIPEWKQLEDEMAALTLQQAGATGVSVDATADPMQQLKIVICDLYREHNPPKLDEVDSMLQTYAGAEFNLYARICKMIRITNH